jgi:hypothetical protein
MYRLVEFAASALAADKEKQIAGRRIIAKDRPGSVFGVAFTVNRLRSPRCTTLWDVRTDDLIPSRNIRRVHYGEA